MMNNAVESKPRTRKIWVGGAASILLATTLVAFAPLSASATTTTRFGPYDTWAICSTNLKWLDDNSGPEWSFGACYQMGPGAAGWYFNRYHD